MGAQPVRAVSYAAPCVLCTARLCPMISHPHTLASARADDARGTDALHGVKRERGGAGAKGRENARWIEVRDSRRAGRPPSGHGAHSPDAAVGGGKGHRNEAVKEQAGRVGMA